MQPETVCPDIDVRSMRVGEARQQQQGGRGRGASSGKGRRDSSMSESVLAIKMSQ